MQISDSRIRVLITVDTEHSIGGAFQNPALKPVGNAKRIYGKIGDRFFGIPLIMDIAEDHDLKIVFFVEVLNKYFFGESETREICDFIVKRGHEVQLHLHPNYLNFKEPNPQAQTYKDNLYYYGAEQQIALIAEGRALLQQYGIRNPTAFRAGNYGFNRYTLAALRQNGFIYDSSYNRCFLNPAQELDGIVINDVHPMDGIFELPITNFLQPVPFRSFRPKPLDINGASALEMTKTLDWALASGSLTHITFIMHSFSFIEPEDLQYSKMKPRAYVINRFRKLCRYLSEHRNSFLVTGFNDLTPAVPAHAASPHKFYCMPSAITLLRMAEQVFHKFAA
jgi:hypothetical protein